MVNQNLKILRNHLIILVALCLSLGLSAQKNEGFSNVDNNLYKLVKRISEANKRDVEETLSKQYIIREDKILCYISKHGKADWKDFKKECESIPGIILAAETFNLGFQNAFVPVDAMNRIHELKTIGMVTAVGRGITNSGDVETEADQTLKTNLIRSQYGYKGKGVKIGVISDGIGPISNPVNGDLGPAGNEVPPIVNSVMALNDVGPQLHVIENNEVNNSAEGLAMIELIHDIAPEADLLFFDYIDNLGNPMSTAIEQMKNSGCHIIVDDISWPGFSFFQTNVGNHILVKQAIEDFTALGGVYVSAVGNFQNSMIEQVYQPNSNKTHLFNESAQDESLSFNIQPGASLPIYFQWSNPWDDAYDDFNIYLFDENGVLLESDVSIENENIGNPYASIVYVNSTNQAKNVFLKIELSSDLPPQPILFRLFIKGGQNMATGSDKIYFNKHGGVISQQMYSNVLTIGTSYWNNLSTITNYSSYGPLSLFSEVFSVPLNRNILLENELEFKPDFTSVDSVSISGAFGFGRNTDNNPTTPPIFTGTSAAAPHFAALLALIKEARPNLSRGEILSLLKQHTEKFGPYIYDKEDGKSIESGYGRVNVLSLFQNLPPQNQNFGNCFDLVYADYNYDCGPNKLYQTVGVQFRYSGRECSTPSTIVINTNNTGDNGDGNNGENGPGDPVVKETTIRTNSNVPPVISVNEECLGCLKDILREAFGCIPGVDEAFAVANWLRKPTIIPPVSQVPGTNIPIVPPIIQEYLDLVSTALEVGECIQDPSLCSCGGLVIKSAPLGCLLGIVCTAEECGLLPQNPLLSGVGRSTLSDLPSVLVEPLENLQITVTALETRLNTYTLIYDSLMLHENFDQLNNEFLPYVFNHQLINSNDSIQLLIEMVQFDFDTTEITGLISKYNQSRRQWNNGNYPNSPQFINWLKLDSLENKLIFIDSIIGVRGYTSHENMLLSSIDQVRVYSIEDDPTQNAVCASTSIALSQKLTMTREAFEGTLKVFNGSVTDEMDSIKLDLIILNEQGVVSNDLFEIDTSALELITAIDGTGTLAANAEGIARIIFIPEIGAAPTIPKYYSFGGSLSYRDPFSGLSTTMPLVPVTLQVNPSPNLYLHYFLQRDIISDDPLTSNIEPTIPASMALMIENNGYGIATNLKIQSAQPQVIDNDKGLALNMNFTGSKIQGQPANMGLTNINFGNINPLSTKVGEWIFTSNVLGHFTGYQTSVRHLSSRGNPDLSLVEGATLHEWIKSIKVYDTQSDGINDFLVNEVPDAADHPDAIYLSQGNQVLDVEYAQAGSFLTPITYPTFTNTLNVDPSDVGWNYLKLNDPGQGDYDLISVTRNQDNQVIPLDNAWLTFVTIPDTRVPVYEHKFHFVDVFADTLPRTYTVVWSPKDPDPPYVDTITGAPLLVSAVKLNQLTVVFSEPIIDSTFTIEDLSLYNQGGPDLIDTTVTITKVDSITYTVDFTTRSNANGYFVFKVETIGISDLSGTPGFYAKQVSWTQFLTVPVITDFIDFPLRGISAAYDTVKIRFNLSLDTATLQASDFFLVKDGNQLTGNMGISLVSADLKTFRLTRMDTLFMDDGLYILGVDLKSIKSTTNIFGLDTQYYAFIVDNQGPDLDTLIKLYTGSLDPQHVTGVKVIFTEDIVTFDTTAVTLYRGLSAQGLSPMDIIEISPKEYHVFWTFDASYVNGSYKFVIDKTKFKDVTLISGSGLDSISWITARNSNLLFTDVNIVPDYGFSGTDGITYNAAGILQFSINEAATNIRLYQQDNTNALTLLSSLASGAANDTLSMPYAVSNGGNTKLVIKAFDQYQNEVSYTKSIFIDQLALQASWDLPQNLSFAVHPDSINLNFNRRVLDYTPSVYSTLTLFKDNVGISSMSLELTELNDSTFRVSGLSTIANLPGDYKLSFKVDSFAKYVSGLPGAGHVDLWWEIANSNLAPIANAGTDVIVKDLGQVTLDGSASSDPNGDSLSYLWYSLDNIPLSNDSVINPAFVVDESHLGKVLTFLLVISDGSYTASDLVRNYIQLDDIILRPKVFLEGPFSSTTGLMSDQLRELNVLPLQNPYIDTTKYFFGDDGKSIDSTILETTGNNAVVDWVYLELYDATLDSIIRGGSFLLQRDGDVVDVDNVSTVKFLDLNQQHSHRLRIYHRNHLPVETAVGVPLQFSTIQTVDLRYDQTRINGRLNGVKKAGQYITIFAGDINQNGQVQNTDLNLVLPKIGQPGYKIEDADMNGEVQQADIQFKIIPNLGRGKQF